MTVCLVTTKVKLLVQLLLLLPWKCHLVFLQLIYCEDVKTQDCSGWGVGFS